MPVTHPRPAQREEGIEGARLPLDPFELVGLEPLERGKLYNLSDLHSEQRACTEEAIRMIERGEYPREAS
jgi:hypothetical protein